MADIGAVLSSELTRIIECPYPPSLSGLADVLAGADILTIQNSILDRSPCAVRKLATIVCDALPLWAYTVRVLQSLCHAPEFQHELLLLKPLLLNDLLTKANSSRPDFDNYAELCILLLSRAPPESTTLPAAAQTFFCHVFEKAVRGSDASAFKSVYSMLNGACQQLPSLLSPELREQFDDELRKALSLNVVGENSMRAMWCFGIVLVVERPRGYKTLTKQWTTPSGQKLFGSAKASYKTVNMACLHVIRILKEGVDVPDDEVLDGIRIASRILHVIDREITAKWSQSKDVEGQTFKTLRMRTERTDLDPVILLETLSFYAMIAGRNNLPGDVVARYESCISNVQGLASQCFYSEVLSVSLLIFAPQLQPATLQTLLLRILDACASAPSSHWLSNLVVLVDELTIAISSSNSLRAHLQHVLSLVTSQEKLSSFLKGDLPVEDASCRSNAVSLQQKLCSAITALLLTTALTARSGDSTLPHNLVIALINKQRRLPPVTRKCLHLSSPVERSSISLFQQGCAQHDGQYSQDWRDRLNSELESQSLYQRDSTIRTVAQICARLETRCNTVEEPLRKAHARTADLEQQVTRLTEDIHSLELKASDASEVIDGLEDEKEKLVVERHTLFAKLEKLDDDIRKADMQAKETLRTVKEESNTKELELRSVRLRYEEDLRNCSVKLQGLNGTIDELKAAQEKKEEDHRSLNEQHEHLRARLSKTQSELERERDRTCWQNEKTQQLEARNFDLENHSRAIETELETANGKFDNLEVGHREWKAASERILGELKLQHTTDTEATAVVFKAQLDHLLQDNRRLQVAYDETHQSLQLLENSVPQLETRIQELTDVCDELNVWRNNVLTSMGLPPQNPFDDMSDSRSRQEVTNPPSRQSSREHRRRKSAVQIQGPALMAVTNNQKSTNTETEHGSTDSHSSQGGGSIPKRRKRPSFKVPATHTPFIQKPLLIAKSTSKKPSPSKRLALGQMSPNRRHTTVGFAVLEKTEYHPDSERHSAKTRQGSLQSIRQAGFDLEEMSLMNTQLTTGEFMAGTGRMPEGDDETTTEL